MRSTEKFYLSEQKAIKVLFSSSVYSKIQSIRRKHQISVNNGNTIYAVDQISVRDKFTNILCYNWQIDQRNRKTEKSKFKFKKKKNFKPTRS